MPLFGELFLSELLNKPVLDPRGEEIGRLKDASIVKGEPLPKVDALIVGRRKKLYKISWPDVNLFNKRIMSAALSPDAVPEYDYSEDDLLAVRDIFDKQIVDANGVKIVRANDIKLEGYGTDAVLLAVDVGMRGILRRLGVETAGDDFLRLFRTHLPFNLISWNYLQPLQPKLSNIALTVPRQMVSEIHPADLADLISQVSPEEGAKFIEDLDVETAAEAISEMEPEAQTAVISGMETERDADIIEEMPPDDAADVLGSLPDEKAKALLESIEKEEAEDIQELLGHEADTAGGLMTNEFISCRPEMTVAEATERFRAEAPETENVYYVYVVDGECRLCGVLSLRDLLFAEAQARLSEIMETNVKSVRPDADEMMVAATITKYNLLALPVVDLENCLLGIVTVDDILDRLLPPQARKKRRGV
jgi:CBS domain-containing protein/sporulation protein YlmC with PRC-barrel domain